MSDIKTGGAVDAGQSRLRRKAQGYKDQELAKAIA